MKDLLEYIVTSLVSKPEAVSIEEVNQDGMVDLQLTVDPSDMGLIIGKGGQTIHAIRKLLTVRAIAEQVRVNLQLSEPEGQTLDSKESDESKSQEASETEESTPVEETPTSTDASQGEPSEEQTTPVIPSEDEEPARPAGGSQDSQE